MVSPVHGDYRRCQAEIPLIILCRFPGPALSAIAPSAPKATSIFLAMVMMASSTKSTPRAVAAR
jgi:hypothetical protein